MTDCVRKYAQEKIARKDIDCAKEYTLSMFSGKYKIVIIYHLCHDGTMRFNQIQRLLVDATHKMLAQQLKELGDDGLVTRTEKLVNNRKAVFYSLTTAGESLVPIIEQMFAWGQHRLNELGLAQDMKLQCDY